MGGIVSTGGSDAGPGSDGAELDVSEEELTEDSLEEEEDEDSVNVAEEDEEDVTFIGVTT